MKIYVWVLVCLVCARPLGAQSISNPTTAKFPASPDHAAVVGTTPLVEHYEFNVTLNTALGPLGFKKDLGKPTPDASGLITVVLPDDFGALTSGMYVAVAVAVGPGGVGKSDPSDPFARVGPPAKAGKPVLTR